MPETSSTPVLDQNTIAALTNLSQQQSQPSAAAMPVLPVFKHDPADPNGAAIWLERIENTMNLHKITDGKEKVQLAANALDSVTYKEISQALLPDKLLGYEDFEKLKTVMNKHFDYIESQFAKRYAAFNTVWKGPEHESIAAIGARVRQQATNFNVANFKQPQLETMLLLMAMRDPGLDGFRTKVLNLLNGDADTTLEKCLEKMSGTYQTQREQKLPTSSSVNFVKKIPSKQFAGHHLKKGGKGNGTSFKHRQRSASTSSASSNASSNASSSSRRGSCDSCGGKHTRAQCRFRQAECYKCGKSGHIQKVCKAKNTSSSSKTPAVRVNTVRATPTIFDGFLKRAIIKPR